MGAETGRGGGGGSAASATECVAGVIGCIDFYLCLRLFQSPIFVPSGVFFQQLLELLLSYKRDDMVFYEHN